MGKTSSVLLIALFTLMVALAGSNRQMAIDNYDTSLPGLIVESSVQDNLFQTVSFDTDTPVISWLHDIILVNNGPPDINTFKNPPMSNNFMSFFLFNKDNQPYCLTSIENLGQGLILNRGSPDARFGKTTDCKTPQHNRQSELARPLSFSYDLLESSPPGYFLLI